MQIKLRANYRANLNQTLQEKYLVKMQRETWVELLRIYASVSMGKYCSGASAELIFHRHPPPPPDAVAGTEGSF